METYFERVAQECLAAHLFVVLLVVEILEDLAIAVQQPEQMTEVMAFVKLPNQPRDLM